MTHTESGVDVAEDSGGLHVDGMDVGDGLHIDTVLQQQLFDLLGLGQNWHYRKKNDCLNTPKNTKDKTCVHWRSSSIADTSNILWTHPVRPRRALGWWRNVGSEGRFLRGLEIPENLDKAQQIRASKYTRILRLTPLFYSNINSSSSFPTFLMLLIYWIMI